MEIKAANKNYLIQSNFFTQSVLRDASEVQKDAIYYLQRLISFHDPNPPEELLFDFDKFLEYKQIKEARNFYSPKEFQDIISGLMHIDGVFYNKQTNQTVFFNLIDNVAVDQVNPKLFRVRLGHFGKIFFYEKYALEYVRSTKVDYTKIEENIIDLKGGKRKKLFEILSQFKSTGIYRVSLEELKTTLGFVEYILPEGLTIPSQVKKRNEYQLKLLFDDQEPYNFQRVEYMPVWSDFRRAFLEPALEEYNNSPNLDIYNIVYTVRKTGRKITGLEFTFKKRMKVEELTDEENKCVAYFKDYGLSEYQVMHLLQRIGSAEMYKRYNSSVTFNNHFDNKDSKYYHRKVWFENETGNLIQNLGAYLYSKVFPELHPRK